ncbi:MAG: ClpXP protease specificity-enhancing factor SspB, partial [Rhodospirillaceae bacterium]
MVEDALRGVLRQALEITKAQGLPGAHHFYITFDTTHPGVRIAASLRAMHPSEMTIVLQHQFWDLTVEEDFFSITLSFSGVSQNLFVPFAAVTAFA